MAKDERSLAIWYEKNTDTDGVEPNAELHFNFWRFRKEKIKHSFLDIGIMLENHEKIENVLIFVPSSKDQIIIEDLGHKFSDSNVATGVFNETLTVQDTAENSYVDLDLNGNSFARVFKFTQKEAGEFDKEEFSYEAGYQGAVIKIKKGAITRAEALGKRLYFRIRITFKKHIPFKYDIKSPDHILRSSYEKVEYIDFRLNQARSLPEDLSRKIKSCNNLEIKRIDFLLVSDISVEIKDEQQTPHKKRVLESGLWSKYTKNPIKSDMMIYHWKAVPKAEESIHDFNTFTKMVIKRSTKTTIFWFVVAMTLINLFSNSLFSFLSTLDMKSYLIQSISAENIDKLEKNAISTGKDQKN